MKQYFKISLLGLVASLNLHGSPLPQNTPVAINPSAERVIEWAKSNNVPELTKILKEDAKNPKDVYQHPITQENITEIEFEGFLDYDRSTRTPINTTHHILGPNYSDFDLVAKFSTPETLQALFRSGVELDSYPNFAIGKFNVSNSGAEYTTEYHHKKAINGDEEAFAGMILHGEYASTPLVTAAADGHLGMVKTIAENAISGAARIDIPNRLDFPAANFIKPGVFAFNINALTAALLNKHFDVAQYLIDKGALPLGGTLRENKKAFLVLIRKSYPQLKIEPIDIVKLVQDAKLRLPPEAQKQIDEAVKQKLDEQRKVALEKETKREQEMLEQNIREFDQALHDHDLPALAWLIQNHPYLLANAISRQRIGSDLRIAQFIHSEMQKQRLPFTGEIFTTWLQGAVRADAVDVVTWLLETIAQFDVKFMIGSMLNASDIVPDSKVEAYLRKTGLFFNVINENRMREHQAEKRAAEEKQRAAR